MFPSFIREMSNIQFRSFSLSPRILRWTDRGKDNLKLSPGSNQDNEERDISLMLLSGKHLRYYQWNPPCSQHPAITSQDKLTDNPQSGSVSVAPRRSSDGSGRILRFPSVSVIVLAGKPINRDISTKACVSCSLSSVVWVDSLSDHYNLIIVLVPFWGPCTTTLERGKLAMQAMGTKGKVSWLWGMILLPHAAGTGPSQSG